LHARISKREIEKSLWGRGGPKGGTGVGSLLKANPEKVMNFYGQSRDASKKCIFVVVSTYIFG